MMTNEIKLVAKNVYGEVKYYPDCKNSKLIAEIASTRTLTRFAITRAAMLGFNVTCRIETPDGGSAEFKPDWLQEVSE